MQQQISDPSFHLSQAHGFQILLADSHNLLYLHQLSLGAGSNSSCCMLGVADKIIKLASILLNIALGGNKQRQKQKMVCRYSWSFLAESTEEGRPCSRLGTRREFVNALLRSGQQTVGAPGWATRHFFGTSLHLTNIFMSQPQTCHGHQRGTEGQQSPCLKE